MVFICCSFFYRSLEVFLQYGICLLFMHFITHDDITMYFYYVLIFDNGLISNLTLTLVTYKLNPGFLLVP
jgi:hypothetical protein